MQVWFKWSEEGNWIELLIYNDKNALVNAAQRSLHRSGYKNTMGLPILKGQRCLVQFVGMTDVRFDFFY